VNFPEYLENTKISNLQSAKQNNVKVSSEAKMLNPVVGICRAKSMKSVVSTSITTLKAPDRPILNVKLKSSFFGKRTRLKANPGTKNKKINPNATLKN